MKRQIAEVKEEQRSQYQAISKENRRKVRGCETRGCGARLVNNGRDRIRTRIADHTDKQGITQMEISRPESQTVRGTNCALQETHLSC